MQCYLQAFDLCEIVEVDKDPHPLLNNPIVAQIQHFNEEKAKKFKAKSCLHIAVSESIFEKILCFQIAKEIWDYLKEEFHGNDKT